ncbi:uncharacterized protein LOC6652229 isoform X9 [Drosophila willistoni]|uniref:uncharacterized protein LOC6652229 isoform X9 n=1 Tax=Drosophila willistoni TaxID=7260 RepID=UPI001F0854FF|nr:uncharacterized protein LOC6652229 isoform X9 [Drosophila willistoni]
MSFVEYYYFISFFLIFLILLRTYVCPHYKLRSVICCFGPGQSATDRQGTVYSVSDDRPHNRYGDIFFIEPGSEEANRIREQLEKDEKDLPSYDEVMRMCNLTTPTAAAAVAGTAQLPPTIDGNLAIGIAALPAPPYSEADPQASPSQTSAFAVPASNPPSINAISMEPSTSRAAQTPTSPASVTVTLPSTVTNTEV